MANEYFARYPDYFDSAQEEIAAKGYFADLNVEARGAVYRPVFYDPVRFQQEVHDSLKADPCHLEPNLVLVHSVDRPHIDAAVAWLAERDFYGLSQDEPMSTS
jgi:hypothetical protein